MIPLEIKNGSVLSSPSDVLRFDNTYSWTRTKEVKYSARVLPPDTEICQTDGFNGYDEQGELSASKSSTSGNSKDDEDEFEDAQVRFDSDIHTSVCIPLPDLASYIPGHLLCT